MKEIILNNGMKTIVDDEDYEYLNQFRWGVSMDNFRKSPSYVRGFSPIQKSMHRIIMNCPEGLYVDHINGNHLDNRKENLRICTHTQNMQNRKSHRNSTSKYKGVSATRKTKTTKTRWKASINFNKQNINLGVYETENEAALKYNEAAKIYHGEFARLNIIEQTFILSYKNILSKYKNHSRASKQGKKPNLKLHTKNIPSNLGNYLFSKYLFKFA